MSRPSRRLLFCLTAGVAAGVAVAAASGQSSSPRSPSTTPTNWIDDLSPIAARDWSVERAAHLLERAGFGGTPEEIERLAAMTPQQAVDSLVDYQRIDNSGARAFEESGVWDARHGSVSGEPRRGRAAGPRTRRSARRHGAAARLAAAASAGRRQVFLRPACEQRSKRSGSASGGRTACSRRSGRSRRS